MARIVLQMALAFGAGTLACTPHEPPGWDAAPGSLSASPLPAATLAGPPSSAEVPPRNDGGVDDPASLPQTRDRPEAGTAAFDGRVASLWGAIAKDDPSLAMPFFFPLGAYRQVKAIASPQVDWKARLVANYARDIHRLHERLGSEPSLARFVAFHVPDRGRWVEPGEEYNKIGYYRVFGSTLEFETAGRRASFDVRSLISWRGEWYVVHLSSVQ